MTYLNEKISIFQNTKQAVSRVALFYMGEPLRGLAWGKLVGPSHGLWCVVCWGRSLGWKRERQPMSQRCGGRASRVPALWCL